MGVYGITFLGVLLLATLISESVQRTDSRQRTRTYQRYRFIYPQTPSHTGRNRYYYWNPSTKAYERRSYYQIPRSHRQNWQRDQYYNRHYVPGYQRDYAGSDAQGGQVNVQPQERQPRYQECGRYSRTILNIDGQTCAQAVRRRKSACYTYATMSMDCCDACLPLKESNRPGCEYGDRAADCNNLQAAQCYIPFNRNLCCNGCRRHRHQGALADCEYGDRAAWCSTITPQQCYLNHRTCCQTCAHYRRQGPEAVDCEYGDRLDCTEVRSRTNVCYRADIRQKCCSTCRRVRRLDTDRQPIAGCEYGDKIDYIRTEQNVQLSCRNYVHQYGRRQAGQSQPDVCLSPQIADDCCETCASYTRSRG